MKNTNKTISATYKFLIVSVFTFALIIVTTQTLLGRNYYFSALTGDDTRTSLQAQNPATPWKSITKLNAFFISILPGDSVLFRRGEEFYGSIKVTKSGTSSSPIVVGAYGTGSKPVIIGFTAVTSWTNMGGGIYSKVISAESSPGMVLIDGVQYAMGRYPNTGWLYYESHSGTMSITDNQLLTTPNWTGAEAVIKKNNWTVDRNPITNHSSQTLTFISNYGTLTNNWGYYIQNSLSTLDQFGEWYYNAGTSIFYMYFGTINPNIKVVKVSSLDYTISLGSSINFVNFINLSIKGANKTGISLARNNYITVRNCDIDFSGNSAIKIYRSDNITVSNSTVNHSNDWGIISSSTSNNVLVSECDIRNTESIFGQGISNNLSGIGLFAVQGDNIIIEKNSVSNVSYIGISIGGNNQIIRNNHIDAFCLTKTDGGGIYYGGQSLYTNTVIDGNIILNGTGGIDGNPIGAIVGGARGIYIDQNSTNALTISNNSIANCKAHGIFIHSSNRISLKGNTIYNCVYAIGFQESDIWSTLINNLNVTNNIFFAKETTQYTIWGRLKTGSKYSGLGTFNNNFYAKPISDATAFKAFVTLWNGTAYNLSAWKTLSGQDAASLGSPKTITTTNDLRFEYNATNSSKVVNLDANYIDVTGANFNGSITLTPYTSAVLIKNVTSSNKAPTIQNQSFLINTNSTNGTTVGTVVASDPDAGQTLTYSILAGNTGGAFAINSSTGSITVANASALTNTNYSLLQSSAPSTTATNILGNGTAPYEVGMKFSSTLNGYITGLRFYKGVGAQGIHIGNLWSVNGVKLATATFTSETASGWQTVTLANPVAITANTVYIVSYFSQHGDFIFERNYFATNKVNGPLIALASTADQGNGVYIKTSSSAFPSQSNLQSNYWADVDFSSNPTPPTSFNIIVKVQDNGYGNLSSQATVTVLLTDGNNAPVINNQTFTVAENAVPGTTVGTVVASDPDAGQTLTYSILSGNTGGAFTINSSTGSITVANASALTNTNYSLLQSSAPSITATNILGNGTAPYEVGMKFSSTINGYITGLRFYKGVGAQGTHIGNLWSVNGVKLATATFTGETASGWQTVTLTNPVAITANTVYIVSYFSQHGDFIFERNYFATNKVNGPLIALASTADQGNGVYIKTSSSAFPSQSNLQSNYWADVVFTGALNPDSFALAVQVQDNGAGNNKSMATITVNVVPDALKAFAVTLDENTETLISNKVTIFPNPVTNKILNIHLEGQIQEEFYLTIYDLSGRTLIRNQFTYQDKITLNLSELINGLYVLSIRSDNFKYSEKFIVN